MVATPLVLATHWALRPLNYIAKALARAPEDCAEYMLYSLFQTEKGFSRRNENGDDIGNSKHYGSDAERERVWEHSKEEVERALAVKIDSA